MDINTLSNLLSSDKKDLHYKQVALNKIENKTADLTENIEDISISGVKLLNYVPKVSIDYDEKSNSSDENDFILNKDINTLKDEKYKLPKLEINNTPMLKRTISLNEDNNKYIDSHTPDTTTTSDISNLWCNKESAFSDDNSQNTLTQSMELRGKNNLMKKFMKKFKYFVKTKKYHVNNNIELSEITPYIKQCIDYDEYKKSQIITPKIIKKKEKANHEILIEQIEIYKNKLNKDYFVISVKYDKICYKYNTISLAVMVLSTLSTFVEALRLTLTEYMKNNASKILIDIETFTLSINILMLLVGSVMTILSSIIRFKNYRETMEKLKNIQNMIMKYIILYNKQIDLINSYNLLEKMDNETFKDFSSRIKEYNKEINDNINILEDIRNDDVIKLQKFKHDFDIKLENMQKIKDLEILKINNKKALQVAILNNTKDVELFKLDNEKNKKMKELDFIKEEYEKNKFVEVTRLNNKINIDLERLKIHFDNKVNGIYNMFSKNKTPPISSPIDSVP